MTLPDELLAGTDTAKTESKTGQAQMPPRENLNTQHLWVKDIAGSESKFRL